MISLYLSSTFKGTNSLHFISLYLLNLFLSSPSTLFSFSSQFQNINIISEIQSLIRETSVVISEIVQYFPFNLNSSSFSLRIPYIISVDAVHIWKHCLCGLVFKCLFEVLHPVSPQNIERRECARI